jgi:hypothetical protein
MKQRAVIDRLRSADPADGRHLVDAPALRRARVEAILGSTDPDPLASHRSPPRNRHRSRYRRATAVVAAAVAIPCAALAANAVFSATDVERGLPAGAKLLVGTDPVCSEVQRDAVYDCKLKVAPRIDQSGAAPNIQPSWLGAVSLMVDGGARINGGCRSQTRDGTAWRCYIGQAANEQHILHLQLLGTPIHNHCERSTSLKTPPAGGGVPASARAWGPDSAAPGSAIIMCGTRDIVGFAATIKAVPLHARHPRPGGRRP